ncbi:hypothetical protein [Paenibacillus polymyxa]|uniref:hypothetical protein n=1 Tax=Paenibacillus polymyxa TaxID=1406 RepID=UPI0011186487|nr:hypothetical protein [Paenibacillus polymyxa]QDA30223.1 hypothetical protein FGY93_25220 [Paenibacillus polymyxa]
MKKRIWKCATIFFLFFVMFAAVVPSQPVHVSAAASSSGGSGGGSKSGSGSSKSGGAKSGSSSIGSKAGEASKGGEQGQSSEDEDGGMFGFIQELIDKINGMLTMFQDIVSGKLIKDIIHKIIVAEVDEFIAPTYGTFAKSYLFTPRVAEIPIVYKVWSAFTVIGFALLFLSSLWLSISIIRGKKALKKTLITFVVSLFVMMLSLILMNVVNVGTNLMAQQIMEALLTTRGISFAGLDGPQILKALVIGVDGIKDPKYAAQTLGELIAALPGGMGTLGGFTAGVIEPLYVLSVMKNVVLLLMTMGFPLWISYTAFTGKTETLYGFVNMYIRTLLVGLLIGVHWGIAVREQTEFPKAQGMAAAMNIEPVNFTILTTILLFIIVFIYWLKPLWGAVRNPLTLNGGGALEKLGDTGTKVSMIANSIGKRFGSEAVQRKSLDWAEMSKKVAKMGAAMKNNRASKFSEISSRIASSATGGASESVQGIVYTGPEQWTEKAGTIVKQIGENEKEVTARFSLPAGSAFLEQMLMDWTTGEDKSLRELGRSIEPGYDEKFPHAYVPQDMESVFLQAYNKYRATHTPYWTTRSGKIKVIKDGVPTEYGAPPENGMDMGSFEQLQKETLARHAQNKKS